MFIELLSDLINGYQSELESHDGSISAVITHIGDVLEFILDCIIAWWGSLFNYAFEIILSSFESLVNNFQNIFVSIGSRFLNSAFTYNAFHSLQDNFVYFIIGLIVFAFMAKIIFNVFKYCIDLIIGLLP